MSLGNVFCIIADWKGESSGLHLNSPIGLLQRSFRNLEKTQIAPYRGYVSVLDTSDQTYASYLVVQQVLQLLAHILSDL